MGQINVHAFCMWIAFFFIDLASHQINAKCKTENKTKKNAMTIQIKKTSTWLVGLELNAVFYTEQNDKKIMHKSNAFERTF